MKKIGVSTKSLVFTSLSIALVALCTMVLVVPIPLGGYINLGDIMIFTIAITLGKRKGAIAGGVGAFLADILLGFAIYAPGTLIIKAFEGYLCGLIYEGLSEKTNNILSILISCLSAGAFMVLGYFIYDSILYGVNGAIASVFANVIQWGVSVIIAIPLSTLFKKVSKSFLKEYSA